MMKAVIFAGGVGSRLWPLSRKNSPKQFEKILGEDSTLQLAVKRLLPDFNFDEMYISTGAKYVEMVQMQLDKIPSQNIIGEPEMRDVGPAVGLMAALLGKEDPNSAMVILWSDHLVKKEELFRQAIKTAGEIVQKDREKIVFISQKPRFASQNLGWIEYGEKVEERNSLKIFQLKNFKYRPDLETVKTYFQDGHHSWNLGYFVATPGFLLEQYKKFVPEIYEKLMQIQKAYRTIRYETVLKEIYPTLDKISFDNAILERMDPASGLVIPQNLEWSDVGAWEALKEALQGRVGDNVTLGKVLLKDCTDCLVYNYTDQLLTVIDQKSQLVVATPDVVLVCDKNSVPKIKKTVEELEETDYSYLT